ncbi:MAG: hypothetical protein WBL27_10340 [Salinimicrobium sp.]
MKPLLANKTTFLISVIFLLATHSKIFGQEAGSLKTISSEEIAKTGTAEVNKITINDPAQNIPLKNDIFEPLSEGRFIDHVRFGGSLGVSFSNGFFSGYLAPKAVYDFNSYFSAGIGSLVSYSDGSNYTAWTLGGSLIGLARPLPMLQLSAELEENYVTRDLEYYGTDIKENYWTPALFFGIGYTTGPVTAGIRYDVLHDEQKSIYADAFMPFVTILF